MKSQILAAAVLSLLPLCASRPALAQLSGEPYIHDPSTVIQSDGKYYTFGTGGGGLMSDDGYTWHSGAVRTGGGVAPDVIKIGDRYYVSYAVGGGGMSGGHASNVKIMWTKTLDPKSPDFGYHDLGIVASSNGIEDCDAIDPAFLYAKGHLWLSYGTYFGFIRIVELDPKTGLRVAGNKPVNVSIDMEATDMMYRDGWYYLLGTHGTCCDGANSTYNIRVGRSRSPLAPTSITWAFRCSRAAASLWLLPAAVIMGPAISACSTWATASRSSPCITRPTWTAAAAACSPFARCFGKTAGRSAAKNSSLAHTRFSPSAAASRSNWRTDFVRIARAGGFGGFGGPPPGAGAAPRPGQPQLELQGRSSSPPPGGFGGGFMRAPTGPVVPLPDQTLAQDSANWPAGNIGVDILDYMVRPHQKWTITPVTDAGGYPGSPYFKIQIAGTERTLAATADNELVALPAFTGAPEQLWRIDQLTDGTYRIMPKSMDKSKGTHGPDRHRRQHGDPGQV